MLRLLAQADGALVMHSMSSVIEQNVPCIEASLCANARRGPPTGGRWQSRGTCAGVQIGEAERRSILYRRWLMISTISHRITAYAALAGAQRRGHITML